MADEWNALEQSAQDFIKRWERLEELKQERDELGKSINERLAKHRASIGEEIATGAKPLKDNKLHEDTVRHAALVADLPKYEAQLAEESMPFFSLRGEVLDAAEEARELAHRAALEQAREAYVAAALALSKVVGSHRMQDELARLRERIVRESYEAKHRGPQVSKPQELRPCGLAHWALQYIAKQRQKAKAEAAGTGAQ